MNNRIIGEIQGKEKGPLLIYVGGVHGNEMQGIIALENVFSSFKNNTENLKGRAIAIKGNLAAIEQNKRYISKDLNRIWDRAEELEGSDVKEYQEYLEIKTIIEEELKGDFTQAYLIDLHTTSAPTIPFVVTKENDFNKAFMEKVDVPYVTGLKGYLDGTLLEWMCDLGHCGLVFEAGQHHSEISAIKHEAFVRLSMYYTEFISELSAKALYQLRDQLEDELRTKHNHFVLVDRYKIGMGELFEMEAGFSNFEHVYEGEILAKNQEGHILAKADANIFMPLYQKEGNDGFFIIKPKELL